MATATNGKISIGELAATVVAQDPELRDDLRALMRDIVISMRRTMKHGAPNEKLQLVKTITPALLKGLGEADQGESDRRRREAYERMLASVRGDARIATDINPGDT